MARTRLGRSIALAMMIVAAASILGAAPTAAADPTVNPPVAGFGVSISGLDVTFTDASTDGPTTWAWDFGDATTADVQNPVHAFAAAGTYTVALTASNAGGATTNSQAITVGDAAPPPAAGTWSRNLYNGRLVRYQDPDYTACVAASTMMMLNMIATKSTDKGDGFRWTPAVSFATQKRVLRWDRAHMTMVRGHKGTDPNGWRNGLNWFGWGDYTNADTMTYQVFSYSSYGAAVKAAVIAMAKYDKPVAVLGWAGGHAQFLHGYTAVGQNPATSTNFIVRDVYLTDPLRSDRMRNKRITYTAFAHGSLIQRFRRYALTDSPHDDPYTPGVRRASLDWHRKYVIVAPTK